MTNECKASVLTGAILSILNTARAEGIATTTQTSFRSPLSWQECFGVVLLTILSCVCGVRWLWLSAARTKPEMRDACVQSQCTYRRDLIQPRFQVIPEGYR
eukprot:6471577-Amphidinium_carterae.1